MLGFCRKFSFEAICGMVSPPAHAVLSQFLVVSLDSVYTQTTT